MFKKLKDKKGFTLVELIVVLVILAILVALLVPALTGYIDKANQEKAIAERCLPIRKHRGAREKRYSFGYAVFLILALMK